MTFSDATNYLTKLAEGVISVWFIAWAIRRQGEFDIKLTYLEQVVRWLAAAICAALTLLPGSHLAIIRVIAVLTCMSFVAWPNLAHHLCVVLRLRSTENVDTE